LDKIGNLIDVPILFRAPADFGRFAADAFATALSNVRRRRRKAGDPRLKSFRRKNQERLLKDPL
jgi:hypothetical protein